MSIVLVERSFPRPVNFDDIQALEKRGAGCLETHRVRFLRSYFSRDRRRMVCLYEAPDAESVRLSQRNVGVPFDQVWATRSVRHSSDEPDGDAIIVERTLDPPVDEEMVRAAVERGSWCLEQYRCRIVWSYLSNDGKRAVCVFAGPDAESVRQTQRQTGLPFDGVWPASVHEPSSPPS
ncbi:MAG TPA: nickel-binding protein [Vicinamibacteria bacterium]|nr:nickel-binding protein [Vicinamibacteria bacterium]